MGNQANSGAAPLATIIEFLILLALVKDQLHGLGIIRFVAIYTRNNTILSTATLYTALRRMHGLRWIEDAMSPDPDAKGNAEKRKFYRLTPKGRDVIRNDIERLEYLVALAKGIVQDPQAGGSAEKASHLAIAEEPPTHLLEVSKQIIEEPL